jgi:HK97 family phage prohead protease
MADTKKPYGDVTYADPGYQADKKKRYPIDTEAHVRAAWSYVNQAGNAKQYSAEQLAAIKGRIRAAAKRFGIQISDTSSGRQEQSMDVERRYTPGTVEVRMGGEQRRIGGYAAKFGKLSRNLGGFVERVEPSFFNASRADGWPGVICRYNHDDNMLLGSVGGGTLRLEIDSEGLLYEVQPPSARADVTELIERGDVRYSSFAFRCLEDDWSTSDGQYPMRSLIEGQTVDVAPVNSPAYMDATAGLRSLANHVGAPLEDVQELAQTDELRKFFTVTTGPAVQRKRTFGPAARAALLGSKADPWA